MWVLVRECPDDKLHDPSRVGKAVITGRGILRENGVVRKWEGIRCTEHLLKWRNPCTTGYRQLNIPLHDFFYDFS